MEYNKYDYPVNFDKYGLAAVRLNGKVGFINQAGREVFPVIYDGIERGFSEVDGFVRAVVRLNEKNIYINKDGGKQIFYYKFDYERSFENAKSALKKTFGIHYSQFVQGGHSQYAGQNGDVNAYFMRIYDNCSNLQLADRICIESGCTKSWHDQNGNLIPR